MNPKKATCPDDLPIKVIKIASKIVDSHLTNLIHQEIELNSFSEFAKVASIRPLYKKEGKCKIKNCWPLSILNYFSKICETCLQTCLTLFVNSFVSADFAYAYWESFGSNHVLIRLTEDSKKSLDNKNIVGVVLINFLKAFVYIPHYLLIVKMTA